MLCLSVHFRGKAVRGEEREGERGERGMLMRRRRKRKRRGGIEERREGGEEREGVVERLEEMEGEGRG